MITSLREKYVLKYTACALCHKALSISIGFVMEKTKLILIMVQTKIHLQLELGVTDLSEVCLLYFHQQQNVIKEGIFGTTKNDYTMLLIF